MSRSITNAPYGNEGEYSRQPFCDHCSLLSIRGDQLPDWLIASASVTVPFGDGPIYLNSAFIGPRLLSAGFSRGGKALFVATADTGRLRETPGKPVSVVPMSAGVSGTISFGVPPDDNIFQGSMRFHPDAAQLMPSSVKLYKGPHIRSMRVNSSRNTLKGFVTLSGSGGLDLRVSGGDIVAELNRPVEQFLGECDRRTIDVERENRPIRSINSVKPVNGIVTLRLSKARQTSD